MVDLPARREFIVAGNWKMNGTLEMIQRYSHSLINGWGNATDKGKSPTSAVIFPAFCHLDQLRALSASIPLQVGAQNMYFESQGAFTGEISAEMLGDLNVGWVLVGHSERRQLFGEMDEMVAQKVKSAMNAGLRVVLCVGETLDQRKAGLAEKRVIEQLSLGLAGVDLSSAKGLVVAYEPVWAIGTGETATPEIAGSMHGIIRQWMKQELGKEFEHCSILYGGSVTEENAAELFRQPDIDGALVGGASLDAQRFLSIIAAGGDRMLDSGQPA